MVRHPNQHPKDRPQLPTPSWASPGPSSPTPLPTKDLWQSLCFQRSAPCHRKPETDRKPVWVSFQGLFLVHIKGGIGDIYIYVPRTQMTLVLIGNRPCFGGLTFKNRGQLGSRYMNGLNIHGLHVDDWNRPMIHLQSEIWYMIFQPLLACKSYLDGCPVRWKWSDQWSGAMGYFTYLIDWGILMYIGVKSPIDPNHLLY